MIPCPSCGVPSHPGDLQCRSCGTALQADLSAPFHVGSARCTYSPRAGLARWELDLGNGIEAEVFYDQQESRRYTVAWAPWWGTNLGVVSGLTAREAQATVAFLADRRIQGS